MRLYIVLSIVLAALSGSSFALQCYTCEGCEDPTGASTETCEEGQKCVAFQDFAGRVNRGCSYMSGFGPKSDYCRTIVTPGSTTTSCTAYCDDDLCNDKSPADVVDDTLNCYECGSATGAMMCPPDPAWFEYTRGTLTCDGSCIIKYNSNGGRYVIERNCLPAYEGECEPGCNEFGLCVECCNTNLCNST